MGWKNILILGTLSAAACAFFVFLAFGENGVKLVEAKRREHEAVLAANRRMEEENAEMARTIKRLKEDPFFVEFVARQEYGLAGPDDIVFAFDRERTGKPVWPEERDADEARRVEEARKLKREQAEGKKPEIAKSGSGKPKKSKEDGTKKPGGKKADKPEVRKTQKKKEP